ncbi:MAG TPA: NAD(P)-dependent oxidoreductase [Gammaproteobacteria bacterium]|nr:NAD(P)-dependent oxidoreductase [Gammaproteobacteria bacterium]
MAKHVVIWTGARHDGRLCAAVGALAGVRVTGARDRAAALAAIADADALVATVVGWGEDLAAAIARAPRLAWMQALNTGIDSLEKHGVPAHLAISNVGPVNSTSVAEHALLLLLALLRRATALAAAQARHDWAFDAVRPELSTLRGKHVAILGFSYIGRGIAGLCAACGARVTGIAKTARVDPSGTVVAAVANLREVLATADALVVAAPLTAETRELVNAETLAALKRGGLIVNVSRGGIVATSDLLAALDSGQVGGAALDVTDPEPLPPDHPLWTKPNVVITPHVAGIGGGELVRAELEALVVDNVRRFVAGGELQHVVRRPSSSAR